MKEQNIKLPFYAKLALILLMLWLLILLLYVGNDIIMPLLLAVLFSILLRPIVVFANTKLRLPHVLAVLMAVILFVIFIGSIIFFISLQITDFSEDLPRITHNLEMHYQHLQDWIEQTFHISYNRQEKYLEQVAGDNGNTLVESTFHTFTKTLLRIILIPIYTFLILLYRNLFKKFLARLVDEKNHGVLIEIITEIKIVVQRYIVGLLIEMAIIALMVSTGLMLLGVEYAILLGVIAAVLNLIPYIGILVSSILSVIAASINSTEISVLLGAIAVNAIVHIIDNNLLVPKIVASKVKINALVSIVGVYIGSLTAGLTGMFLAIPIIAILKVIFDRIEELKPWGFLIGDELPKTYKWGKIELSSLNAGNETEEEVEKKIEKKIENETDTDNTNMK